MGRAFTKPHLSMAVAQCSICTVTETNTDLTVKAVAVGDQLAS